MINIPIMQSKLNMPQLPAGLVFPTRLQHLCDRMSGQQAVFITAPAGYGKTTLMVTALKKYKAEGCRVCWYRLDQEDRDPAVFYAHLMEALFPAEDIYGQEARSSLAHCGDIISRQGYINALFCQELWAVHSLKPEQNIFIVFDDFQQVLDAPEIAGAVQFFLDNLPDRCTIMVSSRWGTGLFTEKRRLEKDILVITQNELAFRQDELAELVKQKTGVIPESSLQGKIMLHTEGWAAGIIIVCQVLSSSGAGQASLMLEQSGEKEPFFRYIAQEVLKNIDQELYDFLLKAAILNDFTVAEFEVIFNKTNANKSIKLCEQKGLFIQKISGANITYRFHSLFREAIQQIQTRYFAPGQINHYNLKAAAYYMDNGDFSRAIDHFITCGSVEKAVALVTRESARLIAFEAVDQVRQWFRLLPDEVVSENGHLLFIKSFIYYHTDIDYAMRLQKQALVLFQQAGDIKMQFHTMSQMSALYIFRNDMQSLRQLHESILVLSEKLQDRAILDLLGVMNTVLAVFEGQLFKGAELTRRSKPLALVEWQWTVDMYPALANWLLGNLELAEIQIREAFKWEYIKRTTSFRSYCQIIYSAILQQKDDLSAFSGQINDLLESGEKCNFKYVLAFGQRMLAIDCYRRHDLEAALEHNEASTRCWEELNNRAMANSNRLYRCLWLGRSGGAGQENTVDANRILLAAAKKACKALTSAPTGMCLQEIGLSILGAIAREAGDYRLAIRSLNAAIKRSRAQGAKQILAGARLHLAKSYYDSGDNVQGEKHLQLAFDLAEENRYFTFWDLHHPTLVEMAARCVKNNIHPQFARAVMARHYGSDAAAYLSRRVPAVADDQLPAFADSFINKFSNYEDRPAPKVSVALLGKFGITAGGAPIPKTEWKTRKIQGILKYLLLNRGRMVSRERLMELFWPESDKPSALYSLRAALYELRKVLRKYGVTMDGKASFLNEKRDGLGVRTGPQLSVDVDDFRALAGEVKELPPNGNDSMKRRTLLEQMIDLYQGDLLEEDGNNWLFAEKEELRSLYLNAILELSSIHMNNNDHIEAEKLLLQALVRDPYNEEACLRLLELYAASHQRSRAARLYTDFAARFEKDLHIKPDARLDLAVKE